MEMSCCGSVDKEKRRDEYVLRVSEIKGLSLRVVISFGVQVIGVGGRKIYTSACFCWCCFILEQNL